MKLRLELRVKCAGSEAAGKLEEVLRPDNRSVPSDQRFSMSRHGRLLVFEIESVRAKSALSSITSLLDDIHLFSEVWLLSTRDRPPGKC